MKLGYYIPQRSRQIIKDGKVIGDLSIRTYAYGYVVSVHYYDRPGYPIHETFKELSKAESFFKKTNNEINERKM